MLYWRQLPKEPGSHLLETVSRVQSKIEQIYDLLMVWRQGWCVKSTHRSIVLLVHRVFSSPECCPLSYVRMLTLYATVSDLPNFSITSSSERQCCKLRLHNCHSQLFQTLWWMTRVLFRPHQFCRNEELLLLRLSHTSCVFIYQSRRTHILFYV